METSPLSPKQHYICNNSKPFAETVYGKIVNFQISFTMWISLKDLYRQYLCSTMLMKTVSLICIDVQSRRQQLFQQNYTITLCWKDATVDTCFHSPVTNQQTARDNLLNNLRTCLSVFEHISTDRPILMNLVNYYFGCCNNQEWNRMNTVQFGKCALFSLVSEWHYRHTTQKQHLWNPLWTDFRDSRQESVAFSALPTANCSRWTMILRNTDFRMSGRYVDATT